MIEEWKRIKGNTVYSDGILRIRREDYFYNRALDSMTFTVVDMNDWAITIPRTAEGNFIIVRQFRIGFISDTLEFPGGSVNSGEDPEAAALRELAEETGTAAGKISHLGTMQPNPAFMSNLCHVYLAENCIAKGLHKPDKFEDTQTLTVTETELRDMIKNGSFSQGISLAAFGFYLNGLK